MIGPIVIDAEDPTILACDTVIQRKLVIGSDGRIHCTYRKVPAWKAPNFDIAYAYSDDNGQTWNIENPSPGDIGNLRYPNIVVDSGGKSHIVYHSDLVFTFYTNRIAGSWSTPTETFWGFNGTNRVGNFIIGETVRGDDSGKATTCVFYTSTGAGLARLLLEDPVGWVANEWVRGDDSGARIRFGANVSPRRFPALGIDSNDVLHIIGTTGTRVHHMRKPPGGSWTCTGYTGLKPGSGQPHSVIAIGPDDRIHVLSYYQKNYDYVQGTPGSWGAKEDVCTGTTNWGDPSMAVDLDGNVHVVLPQTGLGGVFPAKMNIHYFKRTAAGVWSAVEHVTDDNRDRFEPSIAVDRDGNIRVIFRGRDYGVNLVKENIVMRTKPAGGVWGAIQVLTDRAFDQYSPNMLHALFPKQSKWWGTYYPNCPEGWACIFNGQQSVDVEYLSEIGPPPISPGLGGPSDLLCEQKTNPTDVTDPKPEFSAIHRIE